MAKRVISIGILLLLLLLFYYRIVSTEWRKHFSETEVRAMAAEVNAAPKLTPVFYGIYDKLYPGERQRTCSAAWTLALLKRPFWSEDEPGDMCWTPVAAAEFCSDRVKPVGNCRQRLAFGLEKYTTPEKCFDFAVIAENCENLRFEANCWPDVRPLSDTTDILRYLVEMRHGSWRDRHPERVQKEMSRLRRQLAHEW